jgi:hypothetical protein
MNSNDSYNNKANQFDLYCLVEQLDKISMEEKVIKKVKKEFYPIWKERLERMKLNLKELYPDWV